MFPKVILKFFKCLKTPLIVLSILVLLLTYQAVFSSSEGQIQLPPLPLGEHWELLWSDEFDGTALDSSKWERLGDWPRQAGYWDQSTSFLDGQGHLIVETRRDEQGRYLTGGIRSQGKFEQTYGYYEIRCQFPRKEGHWSDFWLFARPSQFGGGDVHRVGNGGRDGTEVDIFEFQPGSDQDEMRHAVHWDEKHNYLHSHVTSMKSKRFRKGFHTVALWWKPTNYIFYIDNKKVWQSNWGGVAQVPHFIKISSEVFSPSIDFDRDELVVDYIRVYKRNNR